MFYLINIFEEIYLMIKNQSNTITNFYRVIEMEIKTISTDVLIIGSGGAGSRAAIEVDDAGLKAIIVSIPQPKH